MPSGIAGNYPGRRQEIAAGSYAVVPDCPALHGLTGFSLAAMIWPTTPARGSPDSHSIAGRGTGASPLPSTPAAAWR